MSEQEQETRPYRVHMVMPVSTVVDVEAATDVQDAIDQALSNAPQATNSTNTGIDEAGEWEGNAVYDAATDEQVWSSGPDPRFVLARLREALDVPGNVEIVRGARMVHVDRVLALLDGEGA